MKIFLSLSENKILKYCLPLLLTLVIDSSILAQTESIRYYPPPQENDSLKLFFNVKANSFFKNNEYFHPIVEGYTLIGEILEPSLLFISSSDFSANVGARALKYFGTSKLTELVPILRLQYKAHPNIIVSSGTISTGENHNMNEAVFSSERNLTDCSDEGIQIISSFKKFKSDTWLDWEQFIFKDDSLQEIFNIGHSSEFLAFDFKNISLSIPLLFLAYHEGGQINRDPKPPLHMTYNYSSGINADLSFDKFNIVVKNSINYFSNASSSLLTEYKKGFGIMNQLFFDSKYLDISLSHWFGDSFFSPKGDAIYQSVSTINSDNNLKNRQMLTTKIFLNQNITKGCELHTGGEFFYDLLQKRTDYYYALYINFKADFFLKKFN